MSFTVINYYQKLAPPGSTVYGHYFWVNLTPRRWAGGLLHFPQPQLRPRALREDQALAAEQQHVLRTAGAGDYGDGEG